MKASTTSIVPAPQARVWELLQKSSTLVFVAKPWVTFSSAHPFPENWEVGVRYETLVHPFNAKSGSPYQITFSMIDVNTHHMATSESGGLIKEWNHSMSVESVSDTHCRYTDTVDVKAGLLTPPLWVYVKLYYQHRHKRWLKLLEV
jgi:hypothetical protein